MARCDVVGGGLRTKLVYYVLYDLVKCGLEDFWSVLRLLAGFLVCVDNS